MVVSEPSSWSTSGVAEDLAVEDRMSSMKHARAVGERSMVLGGTPLNARCLGQTCAACTAPLVLAPRASRMEPETKRMLEPALSKMMEHFTSQIQQLEKRVECAETNVVTEAERVRAELRAEHDKEVANQRGKHEKAVANQRKKTREGGGTDAARARRDH